MKKEVIQSIEREQKISTLAIERLTKLTKDYESKYGWATADFITKFNDGSIGDDADYFKWFALVQAINDWQRTKDALEEVLDI